MKTAPKPSNPPSSLARPTQPASGPSQSGPQPRGTRNSQAAGQIPGLPNENPGKKRRRRRSNTPKSSTIAEQNEPVGETSENRASVEPQTEEFRSAKSEPLSPSLSISSKETSLLKEKIPEDWDQASEEELGKELLKEIPLGRDLGLDKEEESRPSTSKEKQRQKSQPEKQETYSAAFVRFLVELAKKKLGRPDTTPIMPMPARNQKGAPQFEDSRPEELLRYFDDLEECFKGNTGLTDVDKKKYVGRYVSPRIEAQWQSFDSYAGAGKTYVDYKKDIIKDYPEAIGLSTGSLKRLKQVCKENQRIGESDLSELLTFKRAFKVESKKLAEAPTLLANHTLVAYFAGCLAPEFRNRVYAKLDLQATQSKDMLDFLISNNVGGLTASTAPPARAEDRYKLDEFIRVAEDLARALNPGATGVEREELPLVPPVRIKTESMVLAPVQRELESIKQEFSIFKDWITTSERNQKQLLDEFKNSIHQQTRMVQQMPPPQPAPMRMYQPPPPPMMRYQPPEAPRNCFYCHMTGHMYRDCPVRQAHLTTGKVNLGDGGKLYFPDGRMISFDPTRPVKDRVDEWHAKQKTDVAFQSWETESVPGMYHLQAHQGSMSLYTNQQRDQRDEVIEKLRQELQGRPGPSYQSRPSTVYQQQRRDEMDEYRETYEEMLAAEKQGTILALTRSGQPPRGEVEDPGFD